MNEVPIGDTLDLPSRAGTSFLLSGGRRVGAVVVNPPPAESRLERFTADELRDRVDAKRVDVRVGDGDWARAAFVGSARRSIIDPLVVVALALLLGEALLVGARSREPA